MPMPRHLPSYLFFILLAGGTAHAAELGEARVKSHIGQQLVADIELAMVEDPTQTVQVRVASPEVYRGAGIAPPEVLSSLHLSTMRRDDRQVLHVTSLRPVAADHLHLYLELVDEGQRSVRLATLWLTPDPDPAPAPLAAATPAVMAAPTAPAGPVVAAEPAPVVAEPPARGVRTEAAHPPALARGAARPLAAARPLLLPDPLLHAAPAAHVPPAAPAACARPQPDHAAEACVALGQKNAELRAQLGRLEHKVQGLQANLGMPALSQEAHAEAPPSGPKPINAIKPLVPRKAKVEEADEGLPWLPIGAAAAVLAGIGLLAALRRKRPRNVDIPAEPGALAGVLARLRKRPAAAPAEAAVPMAAEAPVPAAASAVAEPTFE